MKRAIITLTLWLCLSTTGFAQWLIVRERAQEDGTHSYVNLTSADGQTVYTTGAVRSSTDDYLIEKSIDGGHTWVRQNTSNIPTFPVQLNDKFFGIKTLDGVNVIAVGDSGLIVSTHDGGETWNLRNLDGKHKIFDIDISESGVAVVTGNYGMLGLSLDTGRTWQIKEFVDSTNFIACRIFGRDTIYLIDRFKARIMRSEDGGITWNSKLIYPVHYDGVRGVQLYDAHFWNSREGLVVGLNEIEHKGYNNFISRTTDGGMTWTNIMDTLLPNTGASQRIHFFDQNRGIVGTRGKGILLTSDGGVTWQLDSIDLPQETVRGVYGVLACENHFLVIAKTELGHGEIALYNPVVKSVNNSFQNEYLILTPNPVSSKLTIALPLYCEQIHIYNEIGKVVYTEFVGGTSFEYNCHNLPKGVYFVRTLSKNGGSKLARFIKL